MAISFSRVSTNITLGANITNTQQLDLLLLNTFMILKIITTTTTEKKDIFGHHNNVTVLELKTFF